MTERSLIEVMADIAATPAEIEEMLVEVCEFWFNEEVDKAFFRMETPGRFRLMLEARMGIFLAGRRFSGFKKKQLIRRIQAQFAKDYKKRWRKKEMKARRSAQQVARDRRKGRWH